MAGYRVDTADVQRGDAGVAQSCAHSRAAVDRVCAVADDLLGTAWHGPAATGFRLGWERWLAGAHEMLAVLDGMAALLGVAATDYAETEAGVRADVARTPS
jgi:WXG100 family type VII secretion target